MYIALLLRRTPAQTPANTKLRNSPSSVNVTAGSLLNTPVQSKTPKLTGITHKTSSYTEDGISTNSCLQSVDQQDMPISAAQAVSRKLIQKSVKVLNTPRLKASDKGIY